MIVVAIIGILAAVAIPSYQNYTLKAKFTEVVNAVSPYKTAIELCVQDGSCIAAGAYNTVQGSTGIPPTVATTYVASVTVAATGVITALATSAGGLAGETFILTPSAYVAGSPIQWTVSGTCKTRPSGAIC